MTARPFLYRRNGIYYFRWAIPLACRVLMPPGSPVELRTSLRTFHAQTARQLAARHWLAALDTAQQFLVSPRAISYNELLNAIRGHVVMGESSSAIAPEDSHVTLGELAGTTEVQALKDRMALLEQAGAEFYLPVSDSAVEVWGQAYDANGSLNPQLIEVLEGFADDTATLTRRGITAALASDRNVVEITEVHSNQPGLGTASKSATARLTVHLSNPVSINLNRLAVERKFTAAIAPVPAKVATKNAAGDCHAILLSEAKDIWVKDNLPENGGEWKLATKQNYEAYVRQFIDIVGDKFTTELKATDFISFEATMRSLPKNWVAIQKKTGHSPAQIALQYKAEDKLSRKSLKDKASAISLFFSYLEARGFWHGRYGNALFEKMKAPKGKSHRPHFSDDDLRAIYSGAGMEAFNKAQFPLYVWGSILLLYTGARPAEISQLQVKDVVKDDDGTWYLRLMPSEEDEEQNSANAGDAGKQFKTTSSVRSIPLHEDVISLGFLQFIAKKTPDEKLFPEAWRHKQKISREIGDWFNNHLLKASGIVKNGKTLYSLRHTVINRFKANSMLDHFACAYTGHSTSDDKATTNKIYVDTYGRAFTPGELAEKLHPLLNFPIDWTQMKILLKEKKWG